MVGLKKYVVNPQQQHNPADDSSNVAVKGVVNPSFQGDRHAAVRSCRGGRGGVKLLPEDLVPMSFDHDSLDYENVTRKRDYYEEVHFRRSPQPSAPAKEDDGHGGDLDLGDDYEVVIVDNATTRQHNYSYNNNNNNGSRTTSAKSFKKGLFSNGNNETVTDKGVKVRSFINKLNVGKKHSLTGSQSAAFPRTTGADIEVSFGGSLDDIYSKPVKTSTSRPVSVAPADSATSVPDCGGSGATPRPPSSLPRLSNTMRSLRDSLTTLDRLKTSSSSCWPSRLACCKGHDDDQPGSSRSPYVVSDEMQRQEDDVSIPTRKKFVSTSTLCAIIAFSVIISIIAGAILLHQYVSGDVVAVNPKNLTNRSQHQFNSTNASNPTTTQYHANKPNAMDRDDNLDLRLGSWYPSGSSSEKGLGWASWSSWSQCSESCLPGESQARTRACIDEQGNTLNDLKPCINQGGLNVEIRRCLCSQSPAWRSSEAHVDQTSVRFCDNCSASEVCVAVGNDPLPYCRDGTDPDDPTGCAGLCTLERQICDRLAHDAFRCRDTSRSRRSVSSLPTSALCPAGLFPCSNGTCLPARHVCDGHVHCPQGEDEMRCATRHEKKLLKKVHYLHCLADFLPCADGSTCVKADLICDGVSDCPDGSDEPDGCEP